MKTLNWITFPSIKQVNAFYLSNSNVFLAHAGNEVNHGVVGLALLRRVHDDNSTHIPKLYLTVDLVI